MENNDTNTDYHKFVRVGEQKWEIVEITIGIIFFLFAWDLYSLFFIQGVFFAEKKEKKGNKGKKERVSKHKLLIGCHQGENVTALVILERLEFNNFSCRPTMVADNTFQCSIALSLSNPLHRPWWYLCRNENQKKHKRNWL